MLLVATFILRIIRLEELFYFTYDESIPAFVGRRLILWGHIPLIGGVTPLNFHLGPYFYWFLSLILYLGKLNPLSWGIASAFISTVTTFLIYLVGKNFFNKKVGLIAAIFWTFSYLTNVYDRHLWALFWGPILSLIVLFCLGKIIKGRQNFVFPLALTIAFGIHTDPSNLVFTLLTVIVWLIYKLPLNKKTFLGILLIVFSFLPLVVFDIRHDFSNTRPVLEFFNQRRNTPGFEFGKFVNNNLIFPRAFARLIYTFGDNEISKQYSYCQSFVGEKFKAIPNLILLISSISLLTFVVWSFKHGRQNSGFFLLALLTALYYIGIQVYGTIFRADVFEHYITGTFAVFLIIFAKIITLLPKKIWLFILVIFVILNLYKLSLSKNSHGLDYKRQAIEYSLNRVEGKPFSLDSLSTCWKYSGYRYLFAVFGKEPVKSYVDPNFAYLYGTTSVSDKHPKTVVSFVVHDFVPETDEFYKRYAQLKGHEVESKTFGNIEVIIMDNSSNWFD